VEGGGWRVEVGGWRVEGRGWRVKGGGWRVEGLGVQSSRAWDLGLGAQNSGFRM
jgi:hypothetical protein